MLAQDLRRPGAERRDRVQRLGKALGIGLVQVERGAPVQDAVGERHAGAAAGRDAHGVHAAAEEEAARLGRLAEHERAVRREALGPVQEHADLGGLQRGQPVERVQHHGLEVVPVLGQELKREVLAQGLGVDGLAQGLETADQQAARVVADIEVGIVIREGRHVAREALYGPGQEIEMLAGPERGRDAGLGRHGAAPEAGAERDSIAAQGPARGLEPGDAAALGQDAGHAGLLEEARAARPGALGQGRAEVRGADPAVVRRPDRAEHVRGIHERPDLLGLARADRGRAEAEGAGQGLLPPDVDQAVLARGDGERALVDPARGLPGFRLEIGIERDGVADQLGQVAAGPQRPHLGCRVPGRARGQAVALDQNRIADPQLGQVVERGAAHDAAADDDDGGPGRQGLAVAHGLAWHGRVAAVPAIRNIRFIMINVETIASSCYR